MNGDNQWAVQVIHLWSCGGLRRQRRVAHVGRVTPHGYAEATVGCILCAIASSRAVLLSPRILTGEVSLVGTRTVQHQSAATTPTCIRLSPTRYAPLTCLNDPYRPPCVWFASRYSALSSASERNRLPSWIKAAPLARGRGACEEDGEQDAMRNAAGSGWS
jgi:hypothetical protein